MYRGTDGRKRPKAAIAFAVVGLVLVVLQGRAPAANVTDAPRPLTGTALLVGQSDYDHLEDLANPENDARLLEGLLDGLGFETDIATNRNARQLHRAIDGFVEDAEGADVALIYYSGHGIEAGGENYFLPTDADPGSLEAAESTLVALSDVLRRLTAAARISIVLVDACRDNPFPPGALVKSTAAPDGVAVSSSGLGRPKGAFARSTTGAQGNLGVVVAFAAEPGHAALDGAADMSSPYAAALLKHLGATGVSFADVMTMVTEEVYLKTRTRQRPWTNASLRRLLYFGKRPQLPASEEARITGARRTLLLTIAATPRDVRGFVESLAVRDGLPLGSLYGMFRKFREASGVRPGDLERLMQAVAGELSRAAGTPEALYPQDAEFVRFSALADRAKEEGAIDLALEYRERASQRARELSRELDRAEKLLRRERVKIAAAFARHASDAAFAFEHKKASQMYGSAYEEIRRWDDALAFRYKLGEAERLRDHGEYKGDAAALREAVELYKQALPHVRRADNPRDWSKIWNEVGETYSILAQRDNDTRLFEKAVGAFRLALQERTRERMPQRWAGTHDHLGTVYLIMGQREAGPENLARAAMAYETALDELTQTTYPMHWAGVTNNLATARAILGERQKDTENLWHAVRLFEAALTERRRDRVPLEWAATTDNLGTTLSRLGARRADRALLRRARAAHARALEELSPDKLPVAWARAKSNVGVALAALGRLDADMEMQRKAVAAFRAALEEQTLERDPFARAETLEHLGIVLLEIAAVTGSLAEVQEGRQALRRAWEIYTNSGDHSFDGYFGWRLRRADALLKENR